MKWLDILAEVIFRIALCIVIICAALIVMTVLGISLVSTP